MFESDWRVLSLHNADKIDIQTLEHQLNQLSQETSTVNEVLLYGEPSAFIGHQQSKDGVRDYQSTCGDPSNQIS